MCTSMSLKNVTLISMFAMMLLSVLLSRGDFLIRAGGLKIPSIMPAQIMKLILRSFEK